MKNEVLGAITPIQPDGGDALALSTEVDDTLLQSLVWMAAYHGKPTSAASMLSGLPAGRFISPKQAQLAMEQSGQRYVPGLRSNGHWRYGSYHAEHQGARWRGLVCSGYDGWCWCFVPVAIEV
ncbi:hypothetical protein SAMN05414139_00848 [Burkholderia sp. D7]|nr:hypothetical protein SAMN05414139_00848 [Burkholderia sp. D7]